MKTFGVHTASNEPIDIFRNGFDAVLLTTYLLNRVILDNCNEALEPLTGRRGNLVED